MSPGPGAPPRVLVLDVGSSSVRARLFDASGDSLDPGPEARRRYRWLTPEPGVMEYSAGSLLERVVESVDAALASARAAGARVDAVTVATFWHGLLGLGRDGAPVTPVLSWGDRRADGAAAALRREVDEGAAHARTGCFLHPAYPSVKLAWLRDEAPDRFGRAASWVSFPEYLEETLFGERRCSYSVASGTGLFDLRALRWDGEMLRAVGIREAALSPLVDAGEPLSGLRQPWAARWPELAGVPWLPALGDGACANVGHGAVGVGRRCLTVGTSAAVRTLWEPEGDFMVPEGLWCYRLDARRLVAGGALSNGGNGIDFLRGVMRLGEERDWVDAVADLPPDAHGLTVLPYLVAERPPDAVGSDGASVVGLTPATTAAEVARGWMEAVAYRLAEVAGRLDDAFGEAALVRAGGGALHASPAWAQIVADTLDRRIALAAVREVTSRGAALVAAERLGWIADVRAAPDPDERLLAPDPERHARYRAGMERQRRLARALGPWSQPS